MGKLTGPLNSKIWLTGIKIFNEEDDTQIEKIKEAFRGLHDLKLPLDTDYLIIESVDIVADSIGRKD